MIKNQDIINKLPPNMKVILLIILMRLSLIIKIVIIIVVVIFKTKDHKPDPIIKKF